MYKGYGTAGKGDVSEIVKKRAKTATPKLLLKIRNLQLTRDRIANDPQISDDERRFVEHELSMKITHLERERHLKIRSESATRNRLEGETISRYWTQLNREKKPRDEIYALKKLDADIDEGQPTPGSAYEKHSQRMADLACTYHDTLQDTVAHTIQTDEREPVIVEVLSALDKETTRDQACNLEPDLTEDEVSSALKLTKNNTSCGLDGLPNELWKLLHEHYLAETKNEAPETFNVVELMTEVFNDISTYGVDPKTGFTDGWMCPLYKNRHCKLPTDHDP
ncbi:hypothetical protein K435DRAFT_856017 [Dendrothele bispora CBS 962.96]|uniref:Uncharacterized protein n=1 Tax=Dendrothele bispora (strain CBS 962.96) TaxID=1314807 RepID=A0A4S8M9H2_DENBC|nr:hypothetical protein K435DRAFT_856017 [Dendrothele bispora CBS 962.96]